MNEVKGYERKILVELHTNIVTGRVDEKIELEKDNKEVKVYTLVGKAGNDHFGIIAIERVIEAEITEEDIEVVTKKIKEYIEKLKGFGATKAKYIIEVTTISRDEKSSNFKKIRKLSETLGFSFQNFPQENETGYRVTKKSADGSETLLIGTMYRSDYNDMTRERELDEREKKAEELGNTEQSNIIKQQRELSIKKAELITSVKKDYITTIEKIEEIVFQVKINELARINDNILKMGE